MKKILFLIIVLFGLKGASFGQTKAQQTIKISMPTVQCEMCKNRIESTLKRYDGVMFVAVNVKKKETVVKYLADRITNEDIKAAIATLGYDADEIKAEPDGYKRLPTCCKKAEDGGPKSH
jgi:mercuric ion binding protein